MFGKMQKISWRVSLTDSYCNDVKLLQSWQRLQTFFMDIFSTLSNRFFATDIWTATSAYVCIFYKQCFSLTQPQCFLTFSWIEIQMLLQMLLKPSTILKVALIHGCFLRFLNCTNGTKSYKASHIYFTSN